MFATVRSILRHIQALFTRRRLDEEFDHEVETHLTLLTQENIRRGMTPEEAHYSALRSFGGVTQVKEDNRRHRAWHEVEIMFQDLRYAFYALCKNAGFATVAIATLALGIGANTAIFQLLNAVRIRSLPVKDPQELVEIKPTSTVDRRGSVNRFGTLTNPLWEQIRTREQAFSGMFAFGEDQFNLTQGGEARRAWGMIVSGDFFQVLGVRPLRGRLLTAADDQKGCGPPAAVISYSFWQREFGGSPSVIGKTLSLDSHPVQIIGVTPSDFFGFEVGRSYDVAVPICAEPILNTENSRLNNGTAWWLQAIARLKPGFSLEQANAELNSASPSIFQASLPSNYPTESVRDYLNFKLAAYPAAAGNSQLRNDYSNSLWLLLGASGLVLLIACANLANLMLARAAAREREIAVRMALGASRARLLRQFLTESLLLAAIGAMTGFWLARALSGFLVSFLDTNGNPVFLDLNADWRVLGFNAGLAILTCVMFGLTAALRATNSDPGKAMKSGNLSRFAGVSEAKPSGRPQAKSWHSRGRGMTAGHEWFGLRRSLVVGQVALSLVLLTGALLFSRSLRKLLTLDAGFRQTGIVVLNVDFSQLRVPEERRIGFQRVLLDHLRAVPGITSAASIDNAPISGNSWSNVVWMDHANADSPRVEAFLNQVGTDYFKTMDIGLVAGRSFDPSDTAGSPKVAIVNQAFAQKLCGGENPVGKRFWKQQTQRIPETLFQIVGLVKNTKYIDMQEAFRPIVFLPDSQDQFPSSFVEVMLRSDLSLRDVMASVKHAVAEVNPGITLDFGAMKDLIQQSLLPERLIATLSGFFGLLAALLATLGLYGVISYMVARRTNEIGIRMALGADRTRVVGLIMREAAGMLLVGLIVGAILAQVTLKTAESLLYGLSGRDPVTLLAAAGLLAVVALAASHLPARRASRLDPLEALREE
jgi:putative ABC transport system permease protein